MKVLVLSMQTWGEMGNWLSGKSLADGLARERPAWRVTQLALDRIVPRLAEIGGKIRRLTKQHQQPGQRFSAYVELMERLLQEYPPGFEESAGLPAAIVDDVRAVAKAIESHEADLVIGTKGIICRMALAAVQHRIPVVNYVTNHGHFRFAVHSCPSAARHLARLEIGRDFLIGERGYAPESIEVVGYLVNAWVSPDVSSEPAAAAPAIAPHFVVTSNRGGREYVEVLKHLATHPIRPSGMFVGLNDPELCGMASAIVHEAGAVERWTVVEKLNQEDLMALMAERDRVGPTVLVSKASPNSIMEAVYMGIPLFLFHSGLPIEDWSCDLVTANELGIVAEDAAGVCEAIDRAVGADPMLAGFRRRARAYAAEFLNQVETRRRIATALDAVPLPQVRT